MSINSFIDIFSESIEELPETPLTAEVRFKDLKGWDSLAVLTVTDGIDMEYDVLLRKADYQEQATIGDLYQLVCAKKSAN